MAEHDQNPLHSLSGKIVLSPNHSPFYGVEKVHNIFDSAKEGIGSVIHTGKLPHFHKETHGHRDDVDENTSLDDVKAPNVFERAKEEIEALVETIHQKNESHDDKRDHSYEEESKHEERENGVKAPNLIERAKEEIGEVIHTGIEHHFHKETHGKHNAGDEDDSKDPNVFERAKEEMEAIAERIHNRKETEIHDDKRDHSSKDESNREKPGNGVKAQNLIERTKEEIEAVIHTGKEHFHKKTHGNHSDSDEDDDDVKVPKVFEQAEEEIESLVETMHQKKESLTRDDKVPKMFEGAKEEIEALVETIHEKKEALTHDDDKRDHSTKAESKHKKPGIGVKASDLMDKAKDKMDAIWRHDKMEKAKDKIDEILHHENIEKAKDKIDAILHHEKMEKVKDKIDSILHHEKSPNHHPGETHGRNDDIDETTPPDEVKAPNVFERAKEEIEAIVGTMHAKVESNDSVPSAKEEVGFRHCLGIGLEKICHPWGTKRD